MPTNIKVAKSPKEIDDVFRIRHQVFVEEEQMLSDNNDGRLLDHFDAMPTTSNLIVVDEGQVIGSMRMSIDCEIGLPADSYYDFRSILPKDAVIMHCGMFCISNQYRDPKITSGLLLMASYFAMSKKITHVVAPINPKIAKLVQRIGFKKVGEEFIEPNLNHAMLPLVMALADMNDYFLGFVKKNQLQDFLGDYERSFFKKGEYIVRAGEEGRYAYLIVSGSAEARLADVNQKIGELHEGELFGELALLTDEVRSADIVAITDLQVMTLSKAVFTYHFYNRPEHTEKLLKLMGKRTQLMISQLAQLKAELDVQT